MDDPNYDEFGTYIGPDIPRFDIFFHVFLVGDF